MLADCAIRDSVPTLAGAAQAASADDSELVARLHRGDPAAYELLVRQHGGRMLATARRYFACEQDADDAVQDAFLSAFKSIQTFKGDSQLGTWLHRILINSCLMRRRASDRRPACSIESLLPTFDRTGHHTRPVGAPVGCPSQHAITAETRNQVRRAIDSLPEDYRTILILRDIEQLNTETTAEILGVSTAIVKTRLHRARQALRTLLEPTMASD
jgi:RNA polymerase sigma-70 factor, ECF subfamily